MNAMRAYGSVGPSGRGSRVNGFLPDQVGSRVIVTDSVSEPVFVVFARALLLLLSFGDLWDCNSLKLTFYFYISIAYLLNRVGHFRHPYVCCIDQKLWQKAFTNSTHRRQNNLSFKAWHSVTGSGHRVKGSDPVPSLAYGITCGWLNYGVINRTTFVYTTMGGATGGVGGTMSLPLLGPAGYRGTGGGPMKRIFASKAVFIQYCTSDWISTPLTLVNTCQVNDICR